MKKKEFNKILREISTRGRLDIKKLIALDDSIKDAMVHYIVRNGRYPIVEEMITNNIDRSWLVACGYMYETANEAGYNFIHTSEHRIS